MTNLSAPWYTFQRKLLALFGKDPEIFVSDVIDRSVSDGEGDYEIDIVIKDHTKYNALSRVIPEKLDFGSVTVKIVLFDSENYDTNSPSAVLFSEIFRGNPVVEDIKDCEDWTGTRHVFVRFKPEVIQFFNDDISDFNGNWSGLAEDLANDIFEGKTFGARFCTAEI